MTHDHPQPEHDAVVNDVVEAFGRVEVPPMPDVEHTVALLASPPHGPSPEEFASSPPVSWSLFMRKYSPLAVAAALLLAVGGFFFFAPGFDSNAAFAQAVQQFRTAQTLVFTLITTTQGQTLDMKATVKNPGWMQIELEQGNQPLVQVFDFQSQQMVVLVPEQKFAQRVNMAGLPKGDNPNDLIAEFSKLDPEQATYLRDEVKDGTKTHVYDVHAGPIRGTTWIAVDTKRPVRMEFDAAFHGENQAETSMVMRDFAWDVAVDDSKFTLSIPEGYKVRDLDMSHAKPEDFAAMLRIYTALTEEPFPDDFGVENLMSLQGVMMDPEATPEENHARLRERLTSVYGKEALAGERFEETMAEMGAVMGRGGIFMGTLSEEAENWRWVGGGVSPGPGDKVLCWWQPKGSEAYLVITNDFTVKEMAKDELPIYPQ